MRATLPKLFFLLISFSLLLGSCKNEPKAEDKFLTHLGEIKDCFKKNMEEPDKGVAAAEEYLKSHESDFESLKKELEERMLNEGREHKLEAGVDLLLVELDEFKEKHPDKAKDVDRVLKQFLTKVGLEAS